MSKSHLLPIRVYYEDTDAGKIVYYANYLKFAERGRTEMLRAAGFDHVTLLKKYKFGFAVRKCNADYRKAAVLDDELHVVTHITNVSGARIAMEQQIQRDGATLVSVNVVLACLGAEGRGVRMPKEIFDTLQRYVVTAEQGM